MQWDLKQKSYEPYKELKLGDIRTRKVFAYLPIHTVENKKVWWEYVVAVEHCVIRYFPREQLIKQGIFFDTYRTYFEQKLVWEAMHFTTNLDFKLVPNI